MSKKRETVVRNKQRGWYSSWSGNIINQATNSVPFFCLSVFFVCLLACFENGQDLASQTCRTAANEGKIKMSKKCEDAQSETMRSPRAKPSSVRPYVRTDSGGGGGEGEGEGRGRGRGGGGGGEGEGKGEGSPKTTQRGWRMPSFLGGKSRGAFGQPAFFLAGNRMATVPFENEVLILKSLFTQKTIVPNKMVVRQY